MGAIYIKEIKSYFHSIVGYIFVALLLALAGLYHYVYNYSAGYSSYAYTLDGVMILFVLLIPMLTMRIMAEESKQKTDQLLYTSPVSVPKVVLGKYFAMSSLLIGTCAILAVQPVVLNTFGNVNMPASYISLLGFLLLGMSYLAIGMFISSLTENQIIAGVVTFFIILFSIFAPSIIYLFETDAETALIVFSVVIVILCIITWIVMRNFIISALFFILAEGGMAVFYMVKPEAFEGSIEKVFDWFSVMDRFDSFFCGILSLSDIVYYVSLIVVFVFLSIQSVEKRRWN